MPPVALAAGAARVNAVNTGDSMLGYRSLPVGWAFARIEGAATWVPGRSSGLPIVGPALDPDAVIAARRDVAVVGSTGPVAVTGGTVVAWY